MKEMRISMNYFLIQIISFRFGIRLRKGATQ
jgi:hypothetical protein